MRSATNISRGLIWAALLMALPFLRPLRAQVIGLNPTYIAQYYWSNSTNAWEPCPNTSAAEPFGSTPQAFTVAGLNAGLGQWTPGVGVASCLAGGGGAGAVTWPPNGDIVISNGTNAPAGLAPVNEDCVVGVGGSWTAAPCLGVSAAQGTAPIEVNGVSGTPETGSLTISCPTCSAGLSLEHQGSALPDQALLNFWNSPASLSGGALDPNYQAVVFKNDSIGGLAAETVAAPAAFQTSWTAPGSGNYAILYPTSAAVIPTFDIHGDQICFPSTLSVSPFNGLISLEGGSATACQINWTGFGVNGVNGLPAGISPSSVTSIYFGMSATETGWRGSGQGFFSTCGGDGGLGITGQLIPTEFRSTGQTLFSSAYTSGLSSVNYSLVTCNAQDQSSEYTVPALTTWQPFMVVYYSGTAVPNPSTISVQYPLVYNNSTLSLQWPYNVAYDFESGTVPNTYEVDMTSLNPSMTLDAGTVVVVIPQASNTGTTPTLQFQGSAATYNIVGPYGAALAVGDLAAGKEAFMYWSGSGGAFHLTNPQVSGSPGFTLTTTGTTGPATLSGNVLNVPDYTAGEGVTAITPGANITCTTEVSGVCTGNVTVNASGGGGGGAYPTDGNAIFTLTSINDDDYNAIEPAVATSGYACTGSGTYTCVVTSSLAPSIGQWVNMRGTPDFAALSAHFPSYLALGTGYSVFQVTATGSGTFSFTETLGAYTCSSSCGTVSDASYNLPFATWRKLGKPGSIAMRLPNPVNLEGLNTNFASLFPAATVPCYFVLGNEINDVQISDSAATIEGLFQDIWAKIHALGCYVVQESANGAAINQGGEGVTDGYLILSTVEAWLTDQGPQNTPPATGQYWDYFADIRTAVANPTDPDMVASNNGFAFAGADAASSDVARVLYTGVSDPAYKLPVYYGNAVGNGTTSNGWTIWPAVTDTYGTLQVLNHAGSTIFEAGSISGNGQLLLNGETTIAWGSSHTPALLVTNTSADHTYEPDVYISHPFTPDTGAGDAVYNFADMGIGTDAFGAFTSYNTSYWGQVNNSLGSATKNGPAWYVQGQNAWDIFHGDGNGNFCASVVSIGSSSFNAGTTPMCPVNEPFSVGNGAFFVDHSGNATTNNLTVNGTCTGCSSGSGTVTSVAMTMPGAIFSTSVSGSPITTSGTLAPSLLTQTANTVFAGPATGSAATPTFRALASADIPNNAANTTGQAGSVANALTMNNGGSGAASGTTFNGSAAQTLSYNTIGAGGLAAANTWSAANTFSAAGAASTPALSVTGAWYEGTNAMPQEYIDCSGATAPTFSSSIYYGLVVNGCSSTEPFAVYQNGTVNFAISNVPPSPLVWQ